MVLLVAAILAGRRLLQTPAADQNATDTLRQALDAGAYAEAARIAAERAAAVGATGGPETLEAARASDVLVEALVKGGKAAADRTVLLAERIVQVKEQYLGPTHLEVALSLRNLGAAQTDRGEFGKAVPLQERALAIRRHALASDDPLIADSLGDLALPLIYLEQFSKAQQTVEEAKRIRLRGGDPASLPVARTLYLVALLHRYDGNYAEATSALDQVLEIRLRLEPNHPDTAAAQQLSGDLFFLKGDVRGAQRAWTDALTLAEKTLGPEHPVIPRLLRVLAATAQYFGDLARTRELLDRGLLTAERSLTPCHAELPKLLDGLGTLAKYNGNYAEARKFYGAALAKSERCLGATHSLTATSIHNSAELATDMGDFAEAEKLYQRAIGAWSAGLGPDHSYVARGLDALASVIALRGRLAEAEALFVRALSHRRRVFGEDHPDVAATLISLAKTTADSGDLVRALRQVDEAIAIYGRGGLPQNPDYLGAALVLRGTLESRRGDYAQARESFARALAARVTIFGAEHPLTAEAAAAVAATDFARDAYGTALAAALDAERVGRDHLRFTIRYLPERQAMAYAAKRPRGLDLALSIVAAGRAPQLPPVLDSVIQSRGAVLDELAARARSSTLGSDPELAPLQAAVNAARQRFATLMLRSLEGEDVVPHPLLDEARQQKEESERALAERSVAARTELARVHSGIQAIREARPAGTALISFVRYDRTSFTTSRSRTFAKVTPSYIAFVIPPAAAPIAAVPLGPAVTVESAVSAWRREAEGRSAAGVASTAAERGYRTAGVRLRQLVWDPLAAHLNRASHVFIVPDGALNLVSFAALPIGGNQYLVERGPVLHLLSTERDLMPTAAAPTSGLLAVGGPAYDLQVSDPVQTGARRSGCGSVGRLAFEDLPGSRAEAQDIARIWSRTPPEASVTAAPADNMMVLTGQAASKSAVIGASRGRRVVHLATHGFFLGSSCDSGPGSTRGVGGLGGISSRASDVADNPLLFAGLAFAGANRRASGGSGEDAGILTAEEVAALNLQGTEWAVLSACDTGLGEIKAGEGVFGLRRAFQIAGVRTIIMSLWSVEDQSTRTWMRALYEARFQQKLTTAEAVRRANVTIVQSRRARGRSTHPFYWAAFVAAGDWK